MAHESAGIAAAQEKDGGERSGLHGAAGCAVRAQCTTEDICDVHNKAAQKRKIGVSGVSS